MMILTPKGEQINEEQIKTENVFRIDEISFVNLEDFIGKPFVVMFNSINGLYFNNIYETNTTFVYLRQRPYVLHSWKEQKGIVDVTPLYVSTPYHLLIDDWFYPSEYFDYQYLESFLPPLYKITLFSYLQLLNRNKMSIKKKHGIPEKYLSKFAVLTEGFPYMFYNHLLIPVKISIHQDLAGNNFGNKERRYLEGFEKNLFKMILAIYNDSIQELEIKSVFYLIVIYELIYGNPDILLFYLQTLSRKNSILYFSFEDNKMIVSSENEEIIIKPPDVPLIDIISELQKEGMIGRYLFRYDNLLLGFFVTGGYSIDFAVYSVPENEITPTIYFYNQPVAEFVNGRWKRILTEIEFEEEEIEI